jgi:hypothetical protein
MIVNMFTISNAADHPLAVGLGDKPTIAAVADVDVNNPAVGQIAAITRPPADGAHRIGEVDDVAIDDAEGKVLRRETRP